MYRCALLPPKGALGTLLAVLLSAGLTAQAPSTPSSATASQVTLPTGVVSPAGTIEKDISAKDQTDQKREDQDPRKKTDSDGDSKHADKKVVPQQPTDFQLLARDSTGTLLPIFGANLFQNVPSTFSPVDNVPVTPDYVVGPGDEVVVQVWGQTNLRGRYVVDRLGNITLGDVGSVHVAGIPYAKLQSYIRSHLERVYRNFELNVSLGQLRSIQIFVVGNVVRPGTFTVSSLSTLVNALFVSGGPSSTGSLRRIELKRAGKTILEFDLYDLLLRGDKSKDIALLPGDIIFVPTVGPQVAVAGAVLNPAVYELKDERTVDAVLQLAGGLSTTAGAGTIRIERINAHRDRSITDLDLNQRYTAEIRAGDVVMFAPISEKFNNVVTLRGNVQNPGRYQWHPGMRIRDLIPDKAALLTRDYIRAHNQLGLIADSDYQQVKQGRLDVGSSVSSDGRTESRSTAASINSNPGNFRPRTDVILSASDINWNYAVIERLNKVDLTTSLLPFNLGKVVLEGDPANNLELQEGDVVTIFSKADIPVQESQRTRFVRLEGEFVSSGVYSVLPGETLRGLVRRAGGLSADAYLFGSDFRRESTRRLQQQRLNEYIDDLESEMNESAARISASGNSNGQTLVLSPAQIERLRSIRATGRIVLNLSPQSSGIDQIPDIELEDGDQFVIPRTPNTIGVSGAVYNASNFLYQPGARVSKYLQMAGGPTRQADSHREFIIRADGSILSRQYNSSWFGDSFKSLRLAPGDTVVVPHKATARDPMKTLIDIAQIVGQFGIGVAAINVLK